MPALGLAIAPTAAAVVAPAFVSTVANAPDILPASPPVVAPVHAVAPGVAAALPS